MIRQQVIVRGEQSLATPLSPRRRVLWLLVAGLSFAIGIVALFIPGIPTTEFILLAAFAASKSSPRFHGWLCRHPVFGPMIRNWQSGGCVSRRTKLSASLAMSACLVVMAFVVPYHWVVVLVALGMAAGAFWMWRRPEPQAAAD
ncbi:YbaN family protein [Uliginosibacterium sediminicola]|uniref:YbaN family protein n=1 Tax=Uliginosibacterium sediminicola TaxID=2024550 RepID=A0ABU9YYW9_9RHOO